ncbi:O-succinylbenzoic acid--CoA ligase [Planococcus glaciei]|uniref:2-succinylbenzoate--CoA ligase n=1 Tax=Planococcus glaciei TaxID=459472 RepID=A0A7H8QDK7_9BACL|nr:o-succinylbenzoate--CoA ligase [Planococcus glaciei]KOF08960.1 O-succinylbenzoic acid--CoA ligase [Planococcus glaciei]MBX0316662.1 o-succinylbenzoate--CoA ligase [Planococcus glaciei]QKX51525.1 o-succinylbenzoate--CoA ligase [Planococcus glaciei]
MTYPNWLSQRSFLSGSRMALSFKEQQWTFEEINEIALEYAGKLAALGVRQESRVAILAKSNPEFVFVMYGCLHVGCEMVMLNERLAAPELAYQIDDSKAEFVLADDELQGKVADRNPVLFSAIRETIPARFDIQPQWDKERTISIMYTSGTTGNPKGVRQTAENHFSSAVSSALNIGISPEDVWLCSVPLFHISGFSILMRSLIYGMGVRLYEKFDAKRSAEEICNGTVTHMSLVGVMLERVLSNVEEASMNASPRFKAILAGGGPIPVAYIQRAERCGIPVLQTYGMTETSSQTTTLQSADAERKIGSSGKPLFLYQVKIEGTGQPGEKGEILIQGPQVTPGYIGKFSDRNVKEDGWLHTGDIGYMDEEGFLFVIDRRSDLIVSGGENIYPAEIEKVLLAHPAVREAGVCGVTDAQWGEIPAAFVVLNAPAEAEELIDYCKDQIASYKVPKRLSFVEALPRNASNKLLRRELKQWN